jgi:hypothetical protein
MRRLRVCILDLLTNRPARALYPRLWNANLASITPQVVAVWCEEEGHDVRLISYTGIEDLTNVLAATTDLLFVGAFTQSAQLAYAAANFSRKRGVVTALGGPHARCYPEDAQRYFDYVLGFTDRGVINDVLRDCSRHRPLGVQVSATRQPPHLPGVRARWKFVKAGLAKSPVLKIVPMISSLGCPYKCSFCIDSTVDYQTMSGDEIRDDLRFLLTQMQRPRVAWHDPNFGVRFDEILGTIEDAVPPGRIDFIAESSLSLLSESRLRRLEKNTFKALLPGIESWYAFGNKSKSTGISGMEKVRQISEHVNLILRHVPYVQTNFVLGLDTDEGNEPFELTKRFLDLTPGAFPGYSLLTAFGRSAPLNLELQKAGRVLPFPHHFLNNRLAMNVQPKHYDWRTFYDHVIDLTRYSFSWRAIGRRLSANRETLPRLMNVARAVTIEGAGRARYHSTVRRLLDTDRSVQRYFSAESDTLPSFYLELMRHDLGPMWHHLPEGAINHDPNIYLRTEEERDRGIGSAPSVERKGPISAADVNPISAGD